MNREFLKTAGVPDEAIDRIMAEYGKDIQAANAARTAAETELESYKAKVDELEQSAGAGEAVKAELAELKAKLEADRKAAEEAAADERLTNTIRAAFPADKKFVNEYTETAMISQIKAELAKPENQGRGITEIFTDLTKDKTGIFANPNPIVPNMPGFGGADIDDVNDAKLRAAMGLSVKKE